MEQHEIEQLVAAQPKMRSMDQRFYTDEEIYRVEMEKIFMRSWLYAGHISEIPRVGDWFLYELDGESVIIIRAAEDKVNALVNVCRHRGSRLCLEHKGRSKRLTCLYHGWTYDMEGQLRAAAHMGDDFDKSNIRLRRVQCEVLAGMIYINFAEDAASLQPTIDDLGACLEPYDLRNAKVAHRQSYPMAANWKLAVENYCECYHCAPAHPEYSRGHALADPDQKHAEAYERVHQQAITCGLSQRQADKNYADAPGFGTCYTYERYPLVRGHLTGSKDGQPVAPLLGTIKDYFGGCTDFQVGPVTFALAYCDYVVIYAFKPLSHGRSDCDITWLVRGDAEAGKDYDHDRLVWLWDVTTEADKRIIERNAEGVNSRFYEPGPLSFMEAFTWEFLSWYQDALRA
ncbi:MAG: aromatic ring-hydroxylating dioxygenase subunit alpha [Xanthomonadales bacterium]|nr:aromatic ring-hydroxylating dioxygenase subunit alpha [Xanthomonadales bacterium]